MSDFESYAEGLAEEVLSEMADNFFGSRRRMDRHMEHFQVLTGELQPAFRYAAERVEMLHFLFPNIETRKEFYTLVGVGWDDVPVSMEEERVPVLERMPWALTRRRKYLSMVEATYSAMGRAVLEYMYGKEYADPEEPRRKLLTVHYVGLKHLERQINATLEKMNGQTSVSGTLQYVRGLDPAGLERENIAGAPADDMRSLDEAFRYEAVDLDATGLTPFPDFPPLSEIRSELRAFAGSVYRKHAKQVWALVKQVRRVDPDEAG